MATCCALVWLSHVGLYCARHIRKRSAAYDRQRRWRQHPSAATAVAEGILWSRHLFGHRSSHARAPGVLAPAYTWPRWLCQEPRRWQDFQQCQGLVAPNVLPIANTVLYSFCCEWNYWPPSCNNRPSRLIYSVDWRCQPLRRTPLNSHNAILRVFLNIDRSTWRAGSGV